ncbi:hypothetical protein C1N80_06190 [Brachybacterium sp. SGAir0954]|uniref:hypothetical protein n=1 Tax=Brachybacterium sp. SGAir0954 TaxID=2571029 RepID=UPI0010CCCE62|nr:hypothetical protein [Brachybacterium sp. SGAir0954]QCR53210.1 hypothetical protein C1N80_06190 [Brachybacterium sp. SGAir0954]
MSIDVSEVRRLATDLGKAPRAVVSEAEKVLEKGALNVKRRMAEDAKQLTGSARHFHGSISYDPTPGAGVGYEVGPDKERMQGALGNLLYFGSRKNAPVLDVEAGLADEEPRLVTAMEQMLEKVMRGA